MLDLVGNPEARFSCVEAHTMYLDGGNGSVSRVLKCMTFTTLSPLSWLKVKRYSISAAE